MELCPSYVKDCTGFSVNSSLENCMEAWSVKPTEHFPISIHFADCDKSCSSWGSKKLASYPFFVTGVQSAVNWACIFPFLDLFWLWLTSVSFHNTINVTRLIGKASLSWIIWIWVSAFENITFWWVLSAAHLIIKCSTTANARSANPGPPQAHQEPKYIFLFFGISCLKC